MLNLNNGDTMSAVAEKLITSEEFERLPETDMRRELVRGRVIETMPIGGIHGIVAGNIYTALRNWAKRDNRGFVAFEVGYRLERTPDTTRAPDVAYIRAERIPASGIPEGYGNLAPDLAVEVVSPSETAQDIRDKVHDFLTAGTPLVWVAYPRTREVVAHTADGLARTFTVKDSLEFDLLLGFSCTVAELFEV
jgi:Uma2 family endonuclease